MAASRHSLISAGLRLSYFTIGWNGLVGAAFALNALLDSSASAVLVWRFRRERKDPVAAEALERLAHRLIVLAMLAIGAYVGVQAMRALVDGSHPEHSTFGIGIALVSLAVLPVLGRLKLKVASRLESAALRGDGVLTLAAAALAAITLVALLVNSAFDWWWADAAAALVIAMALVTEAVRVRVRHRFG